MFPSLSKKLIYRKETSCKGHIMMLEDVITFLGRRYTKLRQNTFKIKEAKDKADKEFKLAYNEIAVNNNCFTYPNSTK